MNYLFEFKFEKGTISAYVYKWCIERKIDSFNSLGAIYADIYGDGAYKKLKIRHVHDKLYEVYATDEIKAIEQAGLERIFPQKARALKIDPPCRKVEVTLSDGFKFVDSLTVPSADLKDYFSNKIYSHNMQEQQVLEFAVLA